MLQGLVFDSKAYPAARQKRALIAGGVQEKAIYEDLTSCMKSLRRGDSIAVAGLRGLGSSRAAIVAALDTIHDKGFGAVDISTGRRSDGRDGAKLLAEAIAELANERRGGDIGKLAHMGAAASAKARRMGRMPLEMCEKYWHDKTLKNHEVLEKINGHPDYRKPYSLGTLYRHLGERQVMSGRPTKERQSKLEAKLARERLRKGAVYFIRDSNGRGPVKIGWSANVEARASQLQTSHHGELQIIAAVEGTPSDEKALHERFARLRLKGEWFRMTGALKTYIRALPRYKKPK